MPSARFKGKIAYWQSDDGLIRLEGWARDGLTDAQIAEQIGISGGTLSTWKRKYPKIGEALNTTKDVVDRNVENALYKNALSGNTTAQIFWLKNRKPHTWRDHIEIDDVDNDNVLKYLDGMHKASTPKGKGGGAK